MGRIVIIHSLDPVIDLRSKGAAVHAWGPFASLVEAQEFEDVTPDDDCYKVALDLVGPDPSDIEAAMSADEDHHRQHHKAVVH